MERQENVIPAKAGIQEAKPQATAGFAWMPACAGMTGIYSSKLN
jgi:hypothetical protein